MRGLTRVALASALLLLASCGEPKSSGRIDVGGRINVTKNHGKADLWGVDFEVFETGNGGASIEAPGGERADDQLVEQSCRLGFGTVQVDLAKLKGGNIAMQIDGKGYGNLVAKDKVVIAADRTVTVNGEVRQPG